MPDADSNATRQGTPTLLGIPFDANSSYLRGPAKAPGPIREALQCDASNAWTETGIDLGVPGTYGDEGDLQLTDSGAFAVIEDKIGEMLARGARPICLGGDHSITYPVLRAFAGRYRQLTILHFDAHPDLYDELQGNRHSHACPFARIMEEGLAHRLVQAGIRTLNAHQREQARRFAVEVFEMRNLAAFDASGIGDPVYISFDMDVIDPAFAPGVSHREPGGLSVREAIDYLHGLRAPIVGADIVEYNPQRDVAEVTATVAAKLLKELLGMMVLNGSGAISPQSHADAARP